MKLNSFPSKRKGGTAILFFFLLFSQLGNAQTWYDTKLVGEHLPGWVINLNGDTIHGKILYDHPAKMANKVIFWDDANPKERQKFKGANLKGYYYEGMYWESIKFNDGSLKLQKAQEQDLFVLELKRGKLGMYEHYVLVNEKLLEQEGNTISILPTELETTAYLRKGDEMVALTDMRFMNFKKGMAKFLSDCETLAKKIENKEYGRLQLMQIVDEYNTDCGK